VEPRRSAVNRFVRHRTNRSDGERNANFVPFSIGFTNGGSLTTTAGGANRTVTTGGGGLIVPTGATATIGGGAFQTNLPRPPMS